MDQKLSRTAASEAVGGDGWRFLLGTLRTTIPTGSLAQAAEVAALAVATAGEHADGHLGADLRPDRVVLTLRSAGQAAVTDRDADLARRISAAIRGIGRSTDPGPLQLVEIAIDAYDIPAIRPFWKAVLAYADEPGADEPGAAEPGAAEPGAAEPGAAEPGAAEPGAEEPGVAGSGAAESSVAESSVAEPAADGPAVAEPGADGPIVDPAGRGPAVWFQRMEEPRPQRNRVHFDICVPHDEAPARLEAALEAGGRLVSGTRAPSWWVLADAEGNEACITTWQGRDPA